MKKAEILRLRLGLANYKVRTGQTDVPLERLQVRPIPGVSGPGRRAALPLDVVREVAEARGDVSSSNGRPRRPLPGAPVRRPSAPMERVEEEREGDADDEEVGDVASGVGIASSSPERDALPRLPPPQQGAEVHTPRRRRFDDEDRLSSSELRGGAASGLLSLSRS